MNSVKEKAYAKINLYLNVLGKRADGFHDIETVMHSLSLADDVTVTLSGRGKRVVRLVLDGNRRLPTDGKNIAYAAAMAFLDRAAIDAEVTVRLTKRIPIAAGLAGGSSDAAATLRAMNRLFSRPLTAKALLSVAESLGSDVPYCLVGGTALCRGRGEDIERLPDTLSLNAVIAIANEHVSTPAAYGALDALFSDFDGSHKDVGSPHLSGLVSVLNEGGKLPGLYNIFESAVLPECPGAAHIKDRLSALGASHVLMSGSGPSVFGLFDDYASAVSAAETLTKEGITAYTAVSVK